MGRAFVSALVCLLVHGLSTQLAKGACEFPLPWSGRWFQSGVQHHLTVNATTIETKGNCVEHNGDKFLVEDKVERCHRCVVIHEKHPNVLQYKETYCVNKHGGLDDLCMQITGDAPLFSMFRSDAAPTACPFRPPFNFTYNRGSGDCNSPVSRADACTEDSRLLLRYQACPDVYNSESTVEELVCLAYWKDGSTRYMMGQLQHKMASTDEDRYRCFVWERRGFGKSKVLFDVAQSGDATCNGLLSPTEGSKTLRLTKVESHHHGSDVKSCRFPRWLTEHHQWHTLDHSKIFHFSPRNATLRETVSPASKVQMKAVCHLYEADTENQAKIVAHVTMGCQSGYVCFVFYKRDRHVIELQQSMNSTSQPEDACQPHNFNVQTSPFITLITSSPEVRQCPFVGRYLVSELDTASASKQQLMEEVTCDQQYQNLLVGCGPDHTMEFQSQCSSEAPVSAYSCHADWSDSNATTRYLIASPLSRKSGGARRYCFVMYNTADAGQSTLLQVATVTETCHRHLAPGTVHQYWAFNMTQRGKCDSGGSRSATLTAPSALALTGLSLTLLAQTLVLR